MTFSVFGFETKGACRDRGRRDVHHCGFDHEHNKPPVMCVLCVRDVVVCVLVCVMDLSVPLCRLAAVTVLSLWGLFTAVSCPSLYFYSTPLFHYMLGGLSLLYLHVSGCVILRYSWIKACICRDRDVMEVISLSRNIPWAASQMPESSLHRSTRENRHSLRSHSV